MRFYKNPQGKLGEINISEIKLDKKSQDDVPRILIGLQTLHNDEEAREEVMQILSKEVLPNTDKNTGRKGMDIWNIYNGTHKLDNKINKMRYNFKTKQRRLYV